MTDKPVTLRVVTPDSDFVVPYISHLMPEVVITDDADAAYSVFITQRRDGLQHRPCDITTTLICPNIVGTAMSGFPMTLAEAIARGRFYHIPDNDARISTIHASDVALAVKLSMGCAGDFTVTDLTDPTIDDLAEALAHRLQQRRIYTLRQPWVRWAMNRKLYNAVTTDDLHDGSRFAEQFGFTPTPVTEYLTTHVYDDESL